MANKLEICNVALSFLGDVALTSLDTNARGELCKIFYPMVLDYVLREHPWNCATTRFQCPPLTETVLFGDLELQYDLPPDCVRVQKLDDPAAIWKVEGRRILTDTDTCDIIYTRRLADASEMDGMLSLAFAVKLAAMLSAAITDKTNLLGGLEELYGRLVNSAKIVDARERSGEDQLCTTLTEVR